MATDPEDAPGALSPPSTDYKIDAPNKEIAAGISVLPSKSLGRKGSPATTLPKEIIEQILYLTDPETFASLVLVNRSWRQASEQPQLYAFHLSRCPSYSATHGIITGPFKDDCLLKFKKLLVQEAKRHLFEAFMRPQQTTVNLISTTTSSSAAFPYGEKFEFVFAARAQFCLAISSSRIIVLDTASQEVSVKRELKVVRRPLSAGILYNGSLLAVLSTPHKVNLYDLTGRKPVFKRSLELDEASHSISLSQHGEVLAAANEGGVEVLSLGENAPQTEKRGVKCDRVDHLSFSCDGTMLLGTTQNSKTPSTVILSAPYFTDAADHDMDHAQLISHMWTSQIIFPNSSRDCSHAALLPRKNDHNSNWTLTYDRTFESFRAVRTDDLRNGTTYFTGPNRSTERERLRSKSALVPGTLPTITPQGELVAAAFLGAEIWLYGVPEDLDNTGVKYENARPGILGSSSVISESPPGPQGGCDTLPRWQVLVDKYRNVFAKGRRIAHVSGVTNICWHTALPTGQGPQSMKERLIIAAPGGVSSGSDLENEEMSSVDGGRLVCLDFNWSPQSGSTKEITIEVGSAEPQLLEEENTDMATEIAIIRRRTVARREGIPRSMVSSVADALRPNGEEPPPVPPVPTSVGFGLDHTANDGTAANVETSPPSPASSGEGVTLEEAAEALDGPYSHAHPRSRNTLYRSATAVEASRRRAPPTIPASGRVEYRRTDGTELPHESDADNWEPPPPPYSKEAVDNLPHHLRHILMSQSSITTMPGLAPQESHAPSETLVQSPISDVESPSTPRRIPSSDGTAYNRVPSLDETAYSRTPSVDNASHSRMPSTASIFTQASRPASAAQDRVPFADSTPQIRAPISTTIPRRPVPRTMLSNERPLSTITDVSSRRRSVAEASRHSTSGQSWLSRHDSNRSPSPELRRQESPKPGSHRYSTHSPSNSSTPHSRSPSSLYRRPLSSYEPRSSLYRAALQPASSISPIQEPVLPPPARQHAAHSSVSSTASTRRSTSLTLSGSNLQQRLDYPLPPPPKPSAEEPDDSPISPPAARTNSNTTIDRDFSPPPAHPAVRPPLLQQHSHASQVSQVSRIPHTSHNQPTALPRSAPTPEPSAYTIMHQQMQSLPLPPPIPESATPSTPKRRSSRFRSPFRLSAAVKAVGSRPLSRAASAMSLRPTESNEAGQPAPTQQLVSSETAPMRPQSKAESIRARSKSRLSKRLSRFRGDGAREEEGVPAVPPMPPGLGSSSGAGIPVDGAGMREDRRLSAYDGRGRRMGRGGEGSWEGVELGRGMQSVVEKERGGWGRRPEIVPAPARGGAGGGARGGEGEKRGRKNEKEKDGGKCIVM